MHWFTYTVISFIGFGIQKSLFKVAAVKKYNSYSVTTVFMLSVAVISSAIWILQGANYKGFSFILLAAVLNSILFTTMTLLRFESLKYTPAVVAFPLFEVSSIIIPIYSLLIFHEKISLIQGVGVGLLVISSFLLLLKKKKGEGDKIEVGLSRGIIFALVSGVISACFPIVSKYVVTVEINLFLYMAVSYYLNVGFSVILSKAFSKKKVTLIYQLCE